MESGIRKLSITAPNINLLTIFDFKYLIPDFEQSTRHTTVSAV
jgi:hypothetical protein